MGEFNPGVDADQLLSGHAAADLSSVHTGPKQITWTEDSPFSRSVSQSVLYYHVYGYLFSIYQFTFAREILCQTLKWRHVMITVFYGDDDTKENYELTLY